MSAGPKGLLWAIGLPLVLAATGVVLFLAVRPKTGPSGSNAEEEDEANVVTVKVIQARKDPSFVLTVQQLATVKPFAEAELRSRVAGDVKFVEKNIDDPVVKGELLIELDVPTLWKFVAQKESIIAQRIQEVYQAHSMAKTARAMLEVSHNNVELKQAEVDFAEATRVFRELRWQRFKVLLEGKSPAVDALAVDEVERDFRAASAAVKASHVAVQKAVAEYQEKESYLETAQADIKLKELLVEVARTDRDRALADANYTRLVAPFNGSIGWQRVTLGSSVEVGSGGQSEPILSVVRTDVVTVITKIPDNVAPYVFKDTEIHFQLDSAKGVVFQGRATRVAPGIDARDATKRVEIDLFNESWERYANYRTECVSAHLTPFGGGNPIGTVVLTASGRNVWSHNVKGTGDTFPVFPRSEKEERDSVSHPRLMPGMTGYARLHLRDFNRHLIPSCAVFGQGGKSYILEVRAGKTVQVPVTVELNDGKLALVARVPGGGENEQEKYLTGDEFIVLNQQLEVGDGQPVKATLEEW